MDVIDLDELEDDQEDELRILAVQNIRPEEDQLQTQPRAARVVKVQQRNPSIVQPWSKCPGYQHENLLLKPNKTVELIDGDFLRIRDIVYNAQTQEVRVCGNRFQRTRDLNGLLERKMNELVLFLEVDLDDPRPHLEQSAVQIPLIEIKKIRSLRLTNQKFPLDRNLQPKDFRTRHDITHEGGLTCRWKYTCTYSTGADRYQNVHKERRLERIRADECTGANVLSDADRRSQWREETIPGGAYKPSLMIDAARSPSIIDEGFLDSVGSSSNQEDHNVEVIATHTSTARVGRNREMSVSEVFWPIKTEKRKHSDTETMSLSIQERTKRPRFDGEAVVEETRRRLSIYTLGNNIEEPDILLSRRKVSEVVISSQTIDFSRDPKSSISEPINLMSSDLSTPPPSGSIHTSALIPVEPVHRLPGQKLTYSDAFCGGGGSTRGAVMAGFQVKWGFDFNKHACETWKANFPNANCYHESSHDFVSRVQHSPRKERFKVDILHLSPPCQFFSPAHTVDGQDDEMNVASLFAVQSVIEAARPRVVTLEQTFGIVNERFRWFFNALIQMFTSHEFSVRWAVIPLQRWGLPQHRRRLIIIASCPGEVLPRMPDATHGENPSLGDTLKPYVSVDSVLASIPANAPDHDRLAVRFAEDKRMAPWDGSKILPRAMTTSGGQNYHPKGFRDFTLREYACLQGFPVCHLFKGNYVKKQIGNAVPPVVAKVLFESVKRDLDIADGIVEGVEVLD
ncbi:S-adenosyl-L-methionine-dependent methyltransferase [Mollisia scopiformis]|uniref:DNA (cytosine-5-)-methyltransferase n=1 Tax=Mollisia scopiformis TaxID=149040 RepID=A0A194XU46_MOLSC|nr:S-adenosyl-L-methionine-dependent methyltransferase [Mollisia scopiformis]KUJ23559.1 S-adenosyl-L-methionine-dependent methyltransferase [Mollisia scopiformis]